MNIESILKRAKEVKIDSRGVEKGDIFIGLRGEKTHGSLFANEALKRGAIFAFVEKGWKKRLKPDERIIEVKDTLKILWEFAKIKRRMNKRIKIIAITGSTGKTTVKDLIYYFLKESGKKVMKSKKSYNNFIGVPLTLCEIKEDTEYLVCEIGTNRKGEIEKLTKLVKPDAGIITKIAPVHLEFLGNMEGIFEEKISLFENIRNPRYFIFNENSYGSERLRKIFKDVILFNIEKEKYEMKNDSIELWYRGIRFKYRGGGYAFLENLLCCLKCMECEGIEIKELPIILRRFKLPPLRMEKIEKEGITYIFDCYNSNPVSMESLLKTYKNSKRRKILITGDMLELGKYSERYHREIAHLAKENGVEIVLSFGKYSLYTTYEAKKIGILTKHFEKIENLAEELKKLRMQKDLVLIKGSRKMQMEKLKEYL